jgi:hypothetical protein
MRHARTTAGLALLAGVTTLGLTGCGGGGGGTQHSNAAGGAPPATTSPSLPGGSAPSSSPPSSAALSPTDQSFIKDLTKRGFIGAPASPTKLVKLGHVVCQTVKNGQSPKSATKLLYEVNKQQEKKSNAPSHLTHKEAKSFVDSSVKAYCPKAAKGSGH